MASLPKHPKFGPKPKNGPKISLPWLKVPLLLGIELMKAGFRRTFSDEMARDTDLLSGGVDFECQSSGS